jgi:hypothetical protein
VNNRRPDPLAQVGHGAAAPRAYWRRRRPSAARNMTRRS